MYQVTVKGRTLEELKEAVSDINTELGNGATVVHGMEKNLEEVASPMESRSTVISEPLENIVPEKIESHGVGIALTSSANGSPVGELDAEGLPWDKRIHAATKTKVKAGTWKTRRGVDADLVAQVKQELVQKVHNAANPPVVPEAPINESTPVAVPQVEEVMTLAPVQEVVQQTVQEVVQPQQPVVVPTPAAPQPASHGHTLDTFKAQFTMILGNLISEGKVTQDYVETLKDHFGVDQIWNLTDSQKEELYTGFVSYGFIEAA